MKSLALKIQCLKQVQLARKRSHQCRCSQSHSKPLLERKRANRIQGLNQSNRSESVLKDENHRRSVTIINFHPLRQQVTSIKTRESQRHQELSRTLEISLVWALSQPLWTSSRSRWSTTVISSRPMDHRKVSICPNTAC